MKRIALFDVDGTLTPARLKASPETLDFLKELRNYVDVGVVGGSDFPKQQEQIGENVLDIVDYSFSENGLVAYKGKEKIGEASIRGHIPIQEYNKFVNFVLQYIANLDIPVKSGTFIELRTGMINISPIGRNCTYQERLDFLELDNKLHIRQKMVEELRTKFSHLNLTFSIGGQISFDVFPDGWSKIYCLKYLEGKYDEIHFFGDKTMKGGNDYEIFTDSRVIGHTVLDPKDTENQCKNLFFPK